MKHTEVNNGDRYGRLIIIKEVQPHVHPCGKRRRKFQCTCDCGNTIEVILISLRSGNTISCGCYHKETIAQINTKTKTTHGHTTKNKRHYLYTTWINMIQRCFNPKHQAYKNYGGRGITVCDRWKNSFENFLSDMGKRPETHSIDRIDNNGNYEPSNCRWATTKEQNQNTRNNKTIYLCQ